jgi:sugar/nucleoside kinase (ribokinase family)
VLSTSSPSRSVRSTHVPINSSRLLSPISLVPPTLIVHQVFCPGGSAPQTSLALGLMGAEVCVLTKVGQDVHGHELLRLLRVSHPPECTAALGGP